MEVDFYKYYKNSNIIEHILRDKKNGKLSHSYIFYANTHNDIDILLKLSALVINCENNFCGECNTCRTITNNSNLDIYHLQEDFIKVEDIKKLVDNSNLTANNYYGYKIFLINIEKIRADAQNKLLKTLEEPPKKCIFIIGTTNEGILIETIKSRCVKLKLMPFEKRTVKKEIQRLIPNKDEQSIEIAFALSSQSFIDTYDLLTKKSNLDIIFSELISTLIQLKKSANVIACSSNALFNKDNISASFDLLNVIFRDIMLCIYDNPIELLVPSYEDRYIKIIANGYSKASIIKIIEEFDIAKKKLNFNVTHQNIMSSFFLKILEVNHLCKK